METDTARLEGDVEGFVNRIRYRTNIPPPPASSCVNGTRTRDRINQTIAHEMEHAEAFVGFVNSIRTDERLGVIYPDVEKCLKLRQGLEDDFNEGYRELLNAHVNHTAEGFCGEERFAMRCPDNAAPGTPATEVATGIYYGSGSCG